MTATAIDRQRGILVPSIAEIAATMMIGAERRIDVTAANISNLNTPGYRTHRVFSQIIDQRSGQQVDSEVFARPNRSLALLPTGGQFDLATDADTVLAVRGPGGVLYSRSAQLHRDQDGRLVDGQGRALQSSDSDDLAITAGSVTVSGDGTVIVDGQPQGRIGLFSLASANTGRAELSESGSVQQGMVAGSDVDLGDEMLELNKASRMAETGAKLFQLHDDLLAKTASQLGSISK